MDKEPSETFKLRTVRADDNASVASIIRTVMTEYGATAPGFAIHDPEVDRIFDSYQGERAMFLVITKDDVPVGGGGIQQLRGGELHTCELQKMYLLTEARGHGFGKLLLQKLLDEAKRIGFTECYLETTETMKEAGRLYEKLGFKLLNEPMGKTGHTSACKTWYLKSLT